MSSTAVNQALQKRMVDNMAYDPAMIKFLQTGDFAHFDIRRFLSSGNITSIVDGNGVCAGFDIILTTLCNRVGINAFVIEGVVGGSWHRHTWSAIGVGEEMYYKDSTYEIVMQKVRPLLTREQFYAIHGSYIPLSDVFKYLWVR
jgi:transglutaminase/protease-like cytokinesis protein 3